MQTDKEFCKVKIKYYEKYLKENLSFYERKIQKILELHTYL